ncbi:MAG TPA: AraC family transcriptional regulator [Gemmatimonadales bacterium]|nr:AraC family transcriptional regulator [Gemmatimonadales bacterium]
MNREVALHRTPTLYLSRHDHPAEHEHVDPAEEVGGHWAVSLVERNAFEVHTQARGWRLAEGCAFLNRPGMVYRCRHFHHEPLDVCLSLVIDESLIDALRSADVPLDQAPIGTAPSNRLNYLRHRLLRWHEHGGEPIVGEALAGEVVAAVARAPARPGPSYRPQQLRHYAERVDAVRHRLDTRSGERHALSDLAREAGLSMYHFARIFRELVGVPPHRYLLKVRLARAAALLREGEPVTRSCYQAGFDSVSHFAGAFRKEFGVVPSRYAGGPDRKRLLVG